MKESSMTSNKSISDYEARAIAADEAAEYLRSRWTEDSRERSAGEKVILLLRSEAAACRSHAVRIRARHKQSNGVVSKAASYCLNMRWTGDCVAIWNLAALPLIAFMVLGLFLKIEVLFICTTGLLMLLFLGVGLAAHAPLGRPDGLVEAALERRASDKNRSTLARMGLTPERYLATFPERMWMERVKAAHRLGVSSDGTRLL